MWILPMDLKGVTSQEPGVIKLTRNNRDSLVDQAPSFLRYRTLEASKEWNPQIRHLQMNKN